MAEIEKNHPFQKFDASKLNIGERSGAQPATDVVENDELNDGDETTTTETEGQEEQNEDAGNEGGNEEAANEEGEEGNEAGDEGATADETVDQTFDYGQEEFIEDVGTYLEEVTGGRLKSPSEITNLIQENENLKAQLKQKPQLEFPSEAHKKIYEFATRPEVTGNELGAARQYLHLQSLDLKVLSPKEKQFEAFVLERPDLSREKANQIFDATYTKKFSEMENDLVLTDEHDVKTREAEAKILKYQKEFQDGTKNAQSAAQPEINVQELEQNVNAALADFDGLEMQFGDSPDEVVQLPMSAEEVSEFKEILMNPVKLLDYVVQNSMIDGKFDMGTYQWNMYKLKNVDRAIEQAYMAGQQNGQLKLVAERKNTTVARGTTTGGATGAPKKSFVQTFGDAVKSDAMSRKPARV